ncbi:MAG: TonB-dependent receptor, partial [Leadbetterella sp.]|nr:TonB-dependent receptor [Leadbetterella sp.]
ADRRASRPATPALPSAKAQNAGIEQTYHLTGITHDWQVAPLTSLSTTLFYARNDLTNPFITSYEQRDEKTGGYRILGRRTSGRLILYAGSEGIFTTSGFYVSQNNSGQPGAFLYDTDLLSRQLTHFVQAQLSLPGRVEITGGLSYNTQLYRNETRETGTGTLYVREKPVVPWSPRIAVLHSLNTQTSLFYTFSNGYSPPTAQEMTANFENGQNLRLHAEKGVSHEIGLKSQWTRTFRTEIAAYHQTVRNALVRQVLEDGSEYFLNTGRILQKGLEISNRLTLENKESFLQNTDLLLSFTLNDFRFGSYLQEGADLRGKKLPGAPAASLAFSGKWVQKKGIYLSADLNYISAMYLNNLNTLRSESYTTTRLRTGWKFPAGDKILVNLYAGADNLLNEKYSLGFDFNAIGNRFYNPAPLRNYHAGAGITCKFR